LITFLSPLLSRTEAAALLLPVRASRWLEGWTEAGLRVVMGENHTNQASVRHWLLTTTISLRPPSLNNKKPSPPLDIIDTFCESVGFQIDPQDSDILGVRLKRQYAQHLRKV
jgi:hypothetical protein